MTQYIDKTDLVDKIEKRIKELQDLSKENEKKLDSFQKIAIHLCIDECKVVLNILDTLEVKDDSLDKFKTLQHITGDMKSTIEDWGYAPNLYQFDGSWHVDWISCEEGDSIYGFTAETPEEAINKAYNWFHSTFCNG